MNNILLVAGRSTESLRTFLEKRGSLDIKSFESLHGSREELFSGIYKFDMMVYLLKDKDTNVRKDMQILQELLIGNSFFSVREIIFFVSEYEENDLAVRYFKSVMEEMELRFKEDKSLKLPVYHIRSSKNTIVYDSIYRGILGITDTTKTKNVYKTVYRVEKDENSNESFESSDYRGKEIEPFSFKRVSEYKKIQDVLRRTDSKEFILGREQKQIEKIDKDLGSIDLEVNENNCLIVGVSGVGKSGKSTFCASLSRSFSSKGKKNMILDLSKSGRVVSIFNHYSVPFVEKDIKKLLVLKDFRQDLDVSVLVGFPHKIRFNVLSFVLRNISRMDIECLIVDYDLEDREEVSKFLGNGSAEFLLSTPLMEDLEKLKEEDSTIVITDSVNSREYLSDSEIRDIFPDNTIVKFGFKSLDIDSYLAESLIGGRM